MLIFKLLKIYGRNNRDKYVYKSSTEKLVSVVKCNMLCAMQGKCTIYPSMLLLSGVGNRQNFQNSV